jgi:hypothetical protein
VELFIVLAMLVLAPVAANATDPCQTSPSAIPNSFVVGSPARASEVNDNFSWFQKCPYLAPTATDKVGVGTNSPAAKLDVAGEVKIGSTGVACSAANEGAQRYNRTSKIIEFCNGTSWQAVGGSLSTVTIESGPICVNQDRTAICPAGYVVSGCSWYLFSWGNIFSPVPDNAMIFNNGCYMYVGGSGRGSCFVLQTTCLKVQ